MRSWEELRRVVATFSGVAGANAEAVDANAPRKIADRNFMMLLMYVAGTICMVDGYYDFGEKRE